MMPCRSKCSDVGLDRRLECLDVCTDNLSNSLAFLEEDECGHCTDSELLSDIGDLVDIDLVELGRRVCVGEPTRGKRCVVSTILSNARV